MSVYSVDVTRIRVPERPLRHAAGSPLWVAVRPGLRRGATVAADILGALGMRSDVAGKGRNENASVQHAVAWMRAYETPHLVLLDAQHLPRLTLAKVDAWAQAANCKLWLLHRPPRDESWLLALQRRNPTAMLLRDVPRPSAYDGGSTSRPRLGVQVPTAPFHIWQSTCKARLSPRRWTEVKTRHDAMARAYFDAMARDGGASPERIVGLVKDILAPAPEDDQLIVDVRALQLAAWQFAAYLKTDLTKLLNSEERPTADPGHVDELMAAYRQPHRALIVALTAARVPYRQQRALTRASANPDDSLTLSSGQRVELLPHARRALRAQLQLLPSSWNTPLLPAKERIHSTTLLDARDELGLTIHGRRVGLDNNPTSWLARLGLTLHWLAE